MTVRKCNSSVCDMHGLSVSIMPVKNCMERDYYSTSFSLHRMLLVLIDQFSAAIFCHPSRLVAH